MFNLFSTSTRRIKALRLRGFAHPIIFLIFLNPSSLQPTTLLIDWLPPTYLLINSADIKHSPSFSFTLPFNLAIFMLFLWNLSSKSKTTANHLLCRTLREASSRNIFNTLQSIRNKSLQLRYSSSSLCHLPRIISRTSPAFPPNNNIQLPIHELKMTSNSIAQAIPAQTLDNYTFPTNRLRLAQNDPSKTPLVLVACGSFSPITYLHLRMMEMAADYCKFNTEFELLSGYFSPVSNFYKKAGLASSEHR